MKTYRRLSIEARLDLLRRHRQGESATALARAFGVSERSIYRAVQSHRATTHRSLHPTASYSFRAPLSEVEAFEALAREAGLGRRSTAFRAVLRMAAGLIELGEDGAEAVGQAAWVVGKNGVLLNQLAKAVHKGKLRLTEADRALLIETMRVVRGVEATLRGIAAGAERRQTFARRMLDQEHGRGDG